MQAGKEDWLQPRADLVVAKGKGALQTYFVHPGPKRRPSVESSASSSSLPDFSYTRKVSDMTEDDKKMKEQRLVNWTVDLLHEHVKKLVAKRRPRGGQFDPVPFTPVEGQTPLEEVAEAIILPEFCKRSFQATTRAHKVEVDAPILNQLHQYVTALASMYHDNPFHNFGKMTAALSRLAHIAAY